MISKFGFPHNARLQLPESMKSFHDLSGTYHLPDENGQIALSDLDITQFTLQQLLDMGCTVISPPPEPEAQPELEARPAVQD